MNSRSPEYRRVAQREGNAPAQTNGDAVAACINCGRKFARRRAGHVFCSARCRHLAGRIHPDEQAPDPEVVARLFDPRRDPEEQVRDDDWFPGSPEMQELYAWDTVGKRRRWFRELQRSGALARLPRYGSQGGREA